MDVREKLSSKKRLIDADAFLEKMKRTSRYFNMVFDVEEMPTVDAVEVVRCRNCIHYFSGVCLKIYSDGNVSQDAWQERNEDDFCSYGERKEGADNV